LRSRGATAGDYTAGRQKRPAREAVDRPALKLGISPFTDATPSGNRTAGTDVGRTMMSEVTHSTTLMPRMLAPEGGSPADDLDPEKAVAIITWTSPSSARSSKPGERCSLGLAAGAMEPY
jgi:hypothetical protein